MNKEILDTLVIDRALGVLPPETEALLDAYIGQHPESAAVLELTLDAVSGARTLLKNADSAPLPDFRAPRIVRRRKQRRYVVQIAGMAASLIIGIAAGRNLFDAPRDPGSKPVRSRENTVTDSTAANRIWAVNPARLKRSPARSVRWKGDTPVHHPERMNEGESL